MKKIGIIGFGYMGHFHMRKIEAFPDRAKLVAVLDLKPEALDEARSLGFGAGMGLPNMKRNADEFDIQSTVGLGTTITMGFLLPA